MSSTTGELLQTHLGIRPASATEASLRLLVSTGLQILKADEGSILVYDEANESLRFAMQFGNEESGTNLIGERLSLRDGLTGLAAATREVQIGSPIYRDLKQSERADGSAPEAVIAAPMVVDDRLLGVITGVNFTKGFRFDSQVGRLFGGIAVIAAVLVDQEQRLAALSDALAMRGTGQPEIADRLANLGRQRPEVMADVITIMQLIEKLALPRS
jgi:GAF domain-containing protein